MVGAPIVAHDAAPAGGSTRDGATMTLRFADGSHGTIHYLTCGSKAFPKEQIEMIGGGRVLQIDNYLRMLGFGWPGFRRMGLWRQDKGQLACAQAFLASLRCCAADSDR